MIDDIYGFMGWSCDSSRKVLSDFVGVIKDLGEKDLV